MRASRTSRSDTSQPPGGPVSRFVFSIALIVLGYLWTLRDLNDWSETLARVAMLVGVVLAVVNGIWLVRRRRS